MYIEDKSKVIEDGLVFWIDPLDMQNQASQARNKSLSY
nr:MAG TPA: hypothetical protein [Caudoviricetes sp.]DAT74468.1 MAG TPA: hypothetical protein [Caudoviricetes sp.]